MKISIKKGLGFGLASGIVTTLGLIVGLNASTHSKQVILGGILIIAIADSLSDAFGIHIAEEAGSHQTSKKEIWESTISTFIFKLVFALSFIVPILLLSLQTAIYVSLIWGLVLLTIFSYYLAKGNKHPAWEVILEHIVLLIVVISITHFVGIWINGLI
jgi:vacuolar iron transporter family protein